MKILINSKCATICICIIKYLLNFLIRSALHIVLTALGICTSSGILYHVCRQYLANKLPDSDLEIRVDALFSLVYVQFYLLMMLSMNADVYIAIRFPLYHRVHLSSSRTTVFIVLPCAILSTSYYALWFVFAPNTFFRYYPNVMVSAVAFGSPVYALCLTIQVPTYSAVIVGIAIWWRLHNLFARHNRHSFIITTPKNQNIFFQNPNENILKTQIHEDYQLEIKTLEIVSKPELLSGTTLKQESHSLSSMLLPPESKPVAPSKLATVDNDKAGGNYVPPAKSEESSVKLCPVPPSEESMESGRAHVGQGQARRFKLTFLMLVRFATVFATIDIASWVVHLLLGFENSFVLFYLLQLNAAVDAYLYRYLNPCYGEYRRTLARSLISRIHFLDKRLDRFKFVARLIELVFSIV